MKKYDKLFFIFGAVLSASEIGKQLILTFSVNGGIYDWWYFPFQLCSLPMYLLTAFPFFRSENAKRTILTFLMTFSLLGGIAVFFDTSGMRYPLLPLTIHSYLWHISLIVIGAYSGLLLLQDSAQSGKARLSWRMFFSACLLYACFCITAVVINLAVSPFGRINMFYINPNYPMDQVFFVNIAHAMGHLAGTAAYILATVTGSGLLFAFWNLLGNKYPPS